MTLKFYFTVILILITGQVLSQDNNHKKFKIGINAGANQSNFKGDVLDEYKKAIGYSFGISTKYMLSEKLSLLLHFNYDNKSMVLKNFDSYSPSDPYLYSFENKIIFNYINIPLNANYYIDKGNRVFAQAGVFYNYFLNVENKTTRKDTGENINLFAKPNVKKYDYGFTFGMGYRFKIDTKNEIAIILKDEIGVPNIFDYENNPNVNVKTNSLKFILNWSFAI